MPDQNPLRIISLALSAASLLGCPSSAPTAKSSYVDVDSGDLQSAFGCAAANPSAAETCRLLGDFAAASAFTSWPQASVEGWAGSKYCQPGDSQPLVFYLRPGSGTSPVGGGQPDAARLLPYAAPYPMTITTRPEAWQSLLAALKDGRAPNPQNPAEQQAASLLKAPVAPEEFHVLAKTEGPSFQNFSPKRRVYGRGAGSRLLLLEFYEEGGKVTQPCIAELWKIRP